VEPAGGGVGILYLLGACFLVARGRHDNRARVALLATVGFLLLLSFLPVSFRPLRFVEQQARYLTVV
jgi:hypothetical protein